MKNIISATLLTVLLASCNASESAPGLVTTEKTPSTQLQAENETADSGKVRWKGSFSNGMKGAVISFDVEGNQVKDLTFKGYWRCDGKLEQTTIGPDGTYTIKGKAVEGTIKEDGFYFEMQGTFNGNKASGTLRFAFVAGGCDTYKLNWTAEKQ